MAELLAPAGNIEALDAAIGEGADAVYLGLKSFNARLRTTNFAWNQFEATVNSVHKLGKKIFVTVNTVLEEYETERMYRFLAYLDKIGPDGLIVQDFGVVRMVQQFFPNLRLHASTQMNIASAKAANTMSKSGFKRVVLARELGLDEIKQIKALTKVEIEVFVHGALCVSESGLCLFSSYLGGKSANRGMCTQACRRLYEAEMPGGIEQGFYFSPYDLQLIERVPDLVSAGVDSFKIEGRMKSAEYVGSVVSAYRYMLDHWQEDKKGSLATAKRMLSTDFARSKTMYWYTSPKAENILNPKQASGTGIYLGKITQVKKILPDKSGNEAGAAWYAVIKGGTYDPDIGDSIRLHKKDDSVRESHKIKSIYEDGEKNWVDIPQGFGSGDSVYLLQTKAMSKRYPRVLPNDISRYRMQPGAQVLPVLDLTPLEKDSLDLMPEGLYVQVSTVKDLFVVQCEQPVRVILELNSVTRESLLEKKEKLPFSKRQIFISLDPYLPQDKEDSLTETVSQLVAEGFTNWVV
ncbi:MAG: U32 family peptidase, partial [Spirochaetaceae bacterium]|nr:U32 family peptidase [Spirochaetaceae bacterium]